MALELAIETKHGETWPKAYWRPTETHFNDLDNTGYWKIFIFKDKFALLAGKDHYEVRLQLGIKEVVENKVHFGLKFSDVWEKSKAQKYALLKTKTVKFEGVKYDLSKGKEI